MGLVKVNALSVRLVRMGCKNRPFYQFGATPTRRRSNLLPDEVLGNVDPIPNENNEIIACVDLKRLAFWMGKGAVISRGAENVLGMAGWIPISPRVYKIAAQNREKESEEQLKSETKDESKEENKEEDNEENKEENQFVIEDLIPRKRIC